MLPLVFLLFFLKHLYLSQSVYLEEYNVDVPADVYAKTKNYAVGFTEPALRSATKRYHVEKNPIYDDLLNFVFEDETYTVKCTSGKALAEGKCDNSTQAVAFSDTKASKAKAFLCYYSNWSRYFIKFLPQHIPTDLCTHVVYSFFPITDSYEVRYSDHWADIALNAIQQVVSLKNRGIVKRVILSVGGWTYSGPDLGRWFDENGNEGRNAKPYQQIWNELLTSATNRKTFITSLQNMMNKHGFDGVELDYEYPACPWGECLPEYNAQRSGFENLIKEMRTTYGQSKHISTALSANIRVIPQGPNVATLSKDLDFLSVMTYDYNVYLPNSKSGHNQPKHNVTDSIEYYVNTLKIDPSKILVGVSFYGRGYVVSEEDKKKAILSNSFEGVQSIDGSPAMELTQQLGTANIYELCKMKICNGGTGGLNAKPSCHDNEQTSGDCQAMGFYTNDKDGSWLVYDNVLMAYTDIRDLNVLSQIRSKYNLGGYLIYAIDKDDYQGECKLNGNFPFMRALYNDKLNGDNLLWKPRRVEGNVCDGSSQPPESGSSSGGSGSGGNGNCNCVCNSCCDNSHNHGSGSSGGSGSSSGGNDNGDSINIHDVCSIGSASGGPVAGGSGESNTCFNEQDCKANTYSTNLCDPNKYFVCTAGSVYEMSCPAGLVFNNDLKFCDWPRSKSVTYSRDKNDNPSRHGFAGEPASRGALCSRDVNKNCGDVMYEPQSIEAAKGFPTNGPPDGHIASGGISRFYKLDETGDKRWFKHNLNDYYKKINSTHWLLTMDYKYTAVHRTSGYDLFASYNNYSFDLPIARKYLQKISSISVSDGNPLYKLNFYIQGDKINPSGVLLLVWNVADTNGAFYSVIDYCR